MADEAFALSPISARAAQPSEEDYDAIREAFMETSRGRWFLGEYAKRNRNADTRMVLDAVARIEESLAAQRQRLPTGGLAEALAAIRKAVDEAQSLRIACRRWPRAGGNPGADPQGRPDHPGNRLAMARNRHRRPDLRSARFRRSAPSRLAADRSLRSTPGGHGRCVRPDRPTDRGVWRRRHDVASRSPKKPARAPGPSPLSRQTRRPPLRRRQCRPRQ